MRSASEKLVAETGLNHEFLNINIIISMLTAVEEYSSSELEA
jgi:hypothetical protein